MSKPAPPTPKEPIYRLIMTVMVLSVVAGTILALLGEYKFHDPGMKTVGSGAAVISGAIYFVFRFLGRREAMRRASKGDDGGDEGA